MNFEIFRKRLRFETSDDLLNQNRKLSQSVRKLSRDPEIMKIFVSVLYDKLWPSDGKFKIYLLWPNNVIDDVMGVKHINYTTAHPHVYICKIYLCGTSPSYITCLDNHCEPKTKNTGWRHYHFAIAGDNEHFIRFMYHAMSRKSLWYSETCL